MGEKMKELEKKLDNDFCAYMDLGTLSDASSGTSSEAPKIGDLHEAFVLKFAARTANAVQAILDGLATEPPETPNGIDREHLQVLKDFIVEELNKSIEPPPWLSRSVFIGSNFNICASLSHHLT